MKWLFRILLLAILIGGGAIAFLAITFKKPLLVGVSSIKISAPTDSVLSIVIAPLVYNPNLFGIPIDSMGGSVRVADQDIGVFSADSAFRLVARDTSLAQIRVELSATSLAAHYTRWMSTDSSRVEVNGNAQVKMLFISKSIPLNFSSTIPLKSILTEQINDQLAKVQQIESVQVVDLARDSSILNAVMVMTNPYPFTITLLRTECHVMIGGTEVGSITMSEPVEVAANDTKTIQQHIALGNARSLLGLSAVLLGRNEVEVKGTSTVLMLGQQFVIPIDQKPGLVR